MRNLLTQLAALSPPCRSYLVCAAARNASPPLCKALDATGAAGRQWRTTGPAPSGSDYFASMVDYVHTVGAAAVARGGEDIRTIPTPAR